MRLDLTQVLKNLAGAPMKEEYEEDGEKKERDMCLRTICIGALMVEDGKANAEQQVKRLDLALKMQNSDVINISSEDVTMLKNLIGQVFKRPIIAGQAIKMVEGDIKPKTHSNSKSKSKSKKK